jgi:hypothetical protein
VPLLNIICLGGYSQVGTVAASIHYHDKSEAATDQDKT